ncbi:hypothetical protein PRJ_Dakar_00305 [Faustovirus]|nr:hypothetical protein PRJ_Dakar_00305 [Faustovirus]
MSASLSQSQTTRGLNSALWFHIMGYIANDDEYDVSMIALASACKMLHSVYREKIEWLMPFASKQAHKSIHCEYSIGYIRAFNNYHDST